MPKGPDDLVNDLDEQLETSRQAGTVMAMALLEALDALEGMVEQYLKTYPQDSTEYHHYFMSAGEEACRVLAKLRPGRWELTGSGVRRKDDGRDHV